MLAFPAQILMPHGTTSSHASGPSQSWPDTIPMLTSKISNIRVSSAEMEAIDLERKYQAVALPDGGYFGTLTVFHELHCLVRETSDESRTAPLIHILQK